MDDVSGLKAEGDPPMPPAEFALRSALVAIQLTLVIYFGQSGVLFFYQLF